MSQTTYTEKTYKMPQGPTGADSYFGSDKRLYWRSYDVLKSSSGSHLEMQGVWDEDENLIARRIVQFVPGSTTFRIYGDLTPWIGRRDIPVVA